MRMVIEYDNDEYINFLYHKTTDTIIQDKKIKKSMNKSDWYRMIFELGLKQIDKDATYQTMYKDYKKNKIENE
jgi:hypothetical protein